MQKALILGLFLIAAVTGHAQDVDHFEVGPYEVDYRGEGDFKYRLKKDVNLYKYYGLKQDTVVQYSESGGLPVTHGVQLSLSLMMQRFMVNSSANVFGADGQWKQRIANGVYFNAGLSLAMLFCNYGEHWGNESESLFEIGVPLSIEFANVNKKKASLYAGIGIVPTFYGATKDIDPTPKNNQNKDNVGGKSGLFIAPRFDFGSYVPVGGTLVRLGGFLQYTLNCSKDDHDKNVFADRIGRCFLGANIGLVL